MLPERIILAERRALNRERLLEVFLGQLQITRFVFITSQLDGELEALQTIDKTEPERRVRILAVILADHALGGGEHARCEDVIPVSHRDLGHVDVSE